MTYNKLLSTEIFGFIKPSIDAHTLGISTISNLLRDCGYKAIISDNEISQNITEIQKINNFSLLQQWIHQNHITRIGFSYRLDPVEARVYFCRLFYLLKEYKMFVENGGILRGIFFAGLPDACQLVKQEFGDNVIVFPGDETPIESLSRLGVPPSKIPKGMLQNDDYDNMRWNFAVKLIEEGEYNKIPIPDHQNYIDYGTNSDSYLKRLEYCKSKQSLPIIRAHVGPYNPDRIEAIKEFIDWEKRLARTGWLDVLSIGSSQLTQSNFNENWEGLPNGGGVPINSELEYIQIKEAAKPMLVRTYAGTKNVPDLAVLHEKTLNISWHALSFWWFCEIDGRGTNSVLNNLREHIEAIRYISSTGKPLEPNVPHHFAFRGADDISYIISGYLAAKTAKKYGISHLILQNMLNTPKNTTGTQDLAKGKAMLRLVKELEDQNFKISLQTRAGLDFFSPDLEKAKIQLAAVSALMDDIDPENDNSPEIIHVVSYSEAVRLATPPIIDESIKITLGALREYRKQRKQGIIENMKYNKDVTYKTEELYEEAADAIKLLEKNISNLYTPEGLFTVFEKGFLPLPYLYNCREKYPEVLKYETAIKGGGIRVIDTNGNIIKTSDRYRKILSSLSI